MAPNRLFDNDGTVSSTEEEEVSSGPDSTDSEAEDQKEDTNSPPTPPVVKKPSVSKKSETQQIPAAADSDEDESGSESESESDSPIVKSRKVDQNIKPLASKPMEDPLKPTKKPRSKPSLPASPTPAKGGSKRPAENEPKDSKRAKKKVSLLEEEESGVKKANTDDQKKQLFQRLWSEEDEIVILKGILDYVAKKGADPVNDMNAFHDFIKTSLHIDVSKTQLQDKVRRLKKKYENNASKEKTGKDRTFSKVHEQKAYDLSKKIWGTEGKIMGIDSSKANGSARKNLNQRAGKPAVSPRVDGLSSPEVVTTVEVEHNDEPEPMQGSTQNLQFGMAADNRDLEEELIKNGLELIQGPKRAELEEKWKKLGMERVKLFLQRVELIREQTKLVLEAMKSRKS